jgi:hypothetical protein
MTGWFFNLHFLPKDASDTRILQVLCVTLCLSAFVAAQQPVAELGAWPPGAFTLLVGLWLAGRVLMNGDFDTSLPACAIPIAHQIPGLKKFLSVDHLLGTSIRSLVLSSRPSPRRLYQGPRASMIAPSTYNVGMWEWDTLTMFKVNQPPVVSFTKVQGGVPTSSNNLDIFEMDIPTPENCNLDIKLKFTTNKNADIVLATKDLFQTLFQKSGHGPDPTDMCLQYWQALEFYQTTTERDHIWSKHIPQGDIPLKVDEYRNKVQEIYDWSQARRTLRIFMRDPPTASNEVTAGSLRLEKAIKAGQLVALLIYDSNFPNDCDVNPVIPLLLRWTEGELL